MVKVVDSLQNNFLDFFYHDLNQRIPICKTWTNDKIPGENLWKSKFKDRSSQNGEIVWLSPKNKPASQKPVAAFQSLSYQSTC